ncbi:MULTISPECIES: RNaseH domain-containing protein [unclassified Bradyrhizobium]|uniref:RNaseH domain-containing protein n=1 Tax=unclassified Bradyrhizobium TaxID=2631580 RepID=UPI0029161115|nr:MULTISPECIES: RNaseH domain-containing protein [unclassified Bradyrhizobium]
MTDTEPLFVRSYGDQSILESAFVWRGLPPSTPSPVPPLRYGWTSTTRDLLKRIARLAAGTNRAEGKELPYLDLRAALQARVGGLVLLDSRFSRTDEGPLFAASGDATDVEAAAHRSVAAWAQLTLRPWAEHLGTDCGDIDLLEEKGRRRELFARLPSPPVPEPATVPDALRSDFRQYADILLAMVASSLEGIELFDGLGPVYRVLDREYGNSIAFETWPSALPGGEDLFSMVANLSIETRPSSRLPFLVVKAAKRIWCREFPAANRLYGRRRISARVLTRNSAPRAVTLSVKLEQGLPKTQINAIVYEAGRETGESFVEDLSALVASRGRAPDLFVGVPFRWGYRPEPKIASGVTLQDQVDLFRKVQERIATFGFQEPRFREVDARIRRPKEFHVQASLHNLINHHFGRVEEKDVPARVGELFGAPEKKRRGRESPETTVSLEPLVAANRERLDKAFGKAAPIDLMFVCRREDEASIFASVVSLIFGDRVKVVRHAMPERVHGTRQQLDGDLRNKRTERAAARREAWLPLAERIRTEFPGAPVIVQAALKYDGRDEDEVNKSVGRNTLATVAGSNVQYLLPPAAGHAAEYMHRVQAALYDLLFGHAGLGPVPAPIVDTAFVDCPHPRTILGISIVSQAPSRAGRPEGATIAVAMKTDVTTGKIFGRVGFLRNGAMDTGKFEPLSKTLVAIAASGITSLGEKQPERRTNFLFFVRQVVNEVATEDPHALVLVDSTSTRSLWTWLSDENISSDIYLEDVAATPPSSWKGLRFVRVREGSAGRLSVLTERKWTPVTQDGRRVATDPVEEVYATAVERLIESLPEGNARARHYLTTHGFDVRNRGARGQSVYRAKTGFQKFGASTPADSPVGKKILMRSAQVKPWDIPSRIPVTLEVTVLPSQSGDSEDAIAALIAGLRNGYAHTGDGTFLPAPLSFRSKIADYMDRYGTGAAEDEPDPDPIDDGDDRRDESEEVGDRADVIGYAETRRWFEGTVNLEEDEIPDFVEPPPEETAEARTSVGVQAPSGAAILHLPIRTDAFAPVAQTSIVKASAMLEAREPGAAAESHKPDQGPMDLDDLLTLLRSRSAPLPAFATEAFISNAIHIVPRDTRLMHDDREWIRKATGYPWPEERPAVEDMPRLYQEALRYPAFAIVFQHQFFPDDNNRGHRGLPKNQIILRNADAWKRLRTKGPIPKEVREVPFLRMLHCAQKGCDKDSQLAEALGLPGHDAWSARCSTATDGLEKLEAAAGEWADLAKYLRAVLGPFRQFGPERTIGEIMDEVVIPQAMRQNQVVPIPAAEPHEPVSPVVAPDPEAQVVAQETDAVHNAMDDLATIEQAWRSECEKLMALVSAASPVGPRGEGIDLIKASVSVLDSLRSRAVDLQPATVSTADLHQDLQRLTVKAAESLNSLLGEPLNAPELLSRLFHLPKEATESELEAANSIYAQANAVMREADAGAAEIERLEATLPSKIARAQAVAIDEERERALRRVLEHVGAAIDVFPQESSSAPSGATTQEPIEQAAVTVLPLIPVVNEPALTSSPPAVPPQSVEDAEAEAAADFGDGVMLDLEVNPLPPAPPAPTVATETAEEAIEDPLVRELVARLDALFAVGEFGLAYHLRQCARPVLPPARDVYTEEELRLAAAHGRAMGLSGQDVHVLTSSRSEALTVAQSLADQEDDRSIARLTMLLAGAIPAALFRPDDGAAVPLIDVITSLKPFEHLRNILTIVEENRRFNFPLTAANLMAVEAHSRESSFVSEAVAAINESVAGLRSAKFRFQYGLRIKTALLQPEGLLGRLSSLTETSHDVAREVAEQLHSREDILRIIDSAGAQGGSQEVDLPARERIFAVLSSVGQQCADLVRALEGLSTLRKSPQRLEIVKRLRDSALAEIDAVLARPHLDGPRLTAAASDHAATILRSVRDTLKGLSSSDRNVPPLAVGLHTPLLWLPNMTWTGGWMPAPYTQERILQEIMNAKIPLMGIDPGKAIADAFEARRAESAFVPAYMLVNIAHWFGVSEAAAESMRAKLDADRETKKSQVKSRLAAAERMIERMRRMAVGSLDQSARLQETLSAINPNNLPAELSPSFLPETLAGDRVEDFNSAFARMKEVENEAQREFDKTAADFTARIAALDEEHKLDPQTAVELRNLLQRREFTTLADWLNMLRTGAPRRHPLPSGILNVRLAEFKKLLPLQQLSAVDIIQAARAMDDGRSYGPLDYSHLEAEQRQQAANIARSLLPALKRHIKASSRAQVKDTLQTVVSQLLFEVTKLEQDEVLTKVKQQVYVFDAKVSLPPVDSESLLLPEFGSLTQGSWRICVATSTMSQQSMLDLAEGASPRGVLLIYLGVLNPERRKNLRLELFKRRRSMLVVDEAIVAVALADKSDHRKAVLEIAQGYSGAAPYRDYNRSAVPPEMFKGRSWERSQIEHSFGSHIVFGGRRLGKTALLRQIHATPPANAIFAYVDMDGSNAVEQMSRRISIFASPVRSEEEFAATITTWLDQDERRRLLLLIDEADNFVLYESETDFRCIRALLRLMADTGNRFKFVLAGLHNVSRIARTENSPLVHISNDPLQIGPLLDKDVDDAEFLIRGPLAAMGFEFENREDVWRILSFTNYYPVLIQVFCEELLRIIHDRAQQTNRLPDPIPTSLVEQALDSVDVRGKLFATFEKTIKFIEGRYELLTYILAARELLDHGSGMSAEGMMPAEVAERAIEYWPAAFPRGSDPVEIEYLLEEMEGFGIARRTYSGGFALRSRSLLELMAYDEADLTSKLEQYHKRRRERIFDPKNNRRIIARPLAAVDSDGHLSPLTNGQEADLLAPFAPAAAVKPDGSPTSPRAHGIGVVFGTECAGVRFVEAALMDAERTKDGLIEVDPRTYEGKKDLFDDAKRPSRSGRPRVLVVSPTTPWRPDWIFEAERLGRVRKGEVRIVFVGDPLHASAWSEDSALLRRIRPLVKLVKLRPVARSYLGSRLESLQLSSDLMDPIIDATGGWSDAVGPLLARISERPSQASALIASEKQTLLAAPGLYGKLGIPPELVSFFRELAQYADGSVITYRDFQHLCTSDGRKISPSILAVYCDVLGIISFSPDQSGNRGLHKVDLNQLVHAALLRPE